MSTDTITTLTEQSPLEQLRDFLNGMSPAPAPEFTNAWTKPRRKSVRRVILETAAGADAAHGMVLWTEYLRAIDACVNMDTHLVRSNTIRVHLVGTDPHALSSERVFRTRKDMRSLASFYASARALGIMTLVDRERSTQKSNSNGLKASVDRVDLVALRAALANPQAHCPKTLLPRKPRPVLGPECRKPAAPATPARTVSTDVDTPYVPPVGVWDRETPSDGGLF